MAGGSPVTPDTDEEPDDEAADAPGHHELQRRLANLQRDLKQHLSEKHIVRASVRAAGSSAEYEEGVRAALDERLGAVLDALVADDVGTRAAQGVPASLFEELNEQLAFCQKAAQCTANREITLNEIKTYICGESTRPLVLVGSSGCGKAALVARAAHLCPTWLPDAAVIIRFVGLTAHSSSSHPLLKSIVDQCSVLHNGSVYRGRNDVPSLTAELTRVLGALGRRRPAVLAVVGAGGLRGARWLPHLLPDNVKMLITVTEEQDDPSSSAILAVLSDGAGGGPNMARAPPPAPAEARAVLAACGAQYARAAPAPPAALQAVHNLTLPLYAKILAWQISLPAETFSEHADPESMMELKISADLEGQLSQLLATAEAALGAARVRVCLAVLTVSRRGLDDTEILDILAQDELFRSDKTYLSWAPAALFWPQLAHLLGAFLRWDGRGRVRWRDVAVQRAAHDRYYPDHEHHARTTLVNYFEGVWFKENDPKMAGRLISQDNKFSDECYNNRKLDELPYQHYHLTKSDPVSFANRPYFTDHSWIYDKIAATDSGHLLEDIELIHLDPLPEHIAVLQEFIQVYSFALDYDVRQFYSLLRFYLEQRIKDGRELKSDICKGWLAAARNPPIPTLIATNVEAKIERDLPRRELSATDGFDSKTYDLVVRLEKCSRYVATLSTEREEICVWDAVRCMKVRVLLGVTHPINLVPIDQYKCIVLCRRELRVYDLNQGTFLLTLKGVMNQKMPYYGLHDEQHLVCLSRNRMYVNLMHVGTGDCVTTFKAGEDRFLNSLLVSGDGRILVCGDETQKPFPLLVWSLTSRKLLYDLRIPHHDFVTSLAAITHEGSYVCVVARELDEPAPNFIVVYDLQSGTLFKKWKPGCDTAALAISSADGCVVSGLEDTRILVWDLVTGNCRFTLWGHTAAPGLLRLARAGAVLLSADHKSRDLSVSLWDLNAGKLIAIYTPPERITSCEVLSGGSIIPLTLENHKMLVTLKLEGPTPEAVLNAQEPYEECYGDAENEGKVFDLRDKEGNGNC